MDILYRKDGICICCEGTGKCVYCDGTGKHPYNEGLKCPGCKGTGKCECILNPRKKKEPLLK